MQLCAVTEKVKFSLNGLPQLQDSWLTRAIHVGMTLILIFAHGTYYNIYTALHVHELRLHYATAGHASMILVS